MKIICIAILTCSSSVVCAQRLGIELFGGVANYQGDLQEKRYTFDKAKAAFGIGASYAITDHFAVKGIFNWGKIQADDKNNKDPYLKKRNLSFRSPIYDASFMGQYHFLNLTTSRVSPYVFTGISLFRYKPYAFDTLGTRIDLQPLSTEGQGLSQYADRKPYKLTQLAIPLGLGVKFAVNQTVSIGWEISMRKTFTDYVDDVSTSYVDELTLLTERGQTSVNMAYRGDELKDGNLTYPADGTKRGSDQFKDWYYFTGITATIKIPSGKLSSGKKGSGTNCPSRVY